MRATCSAHLIIIDLNTVISEGNIVNLLTHLSMNNLSVTLSLLVCLETQFHKYTKERIKLLLYYCIFYLLR